MNHAAVVEYVHGLSHKKYADIFNQLFLRLNDLLIQGKNISFMILQYYFREKMQMFSTCNNGLLDILLTLHNI